MMMDCHTHTKNSPDAVNTVDQVCQRAIQIGLDFLAITDHCETNRFYNVEYYTKSPKEYDTYNFDKDFEISMQENTAAKENFSGKLNLICGIELGQATLDPEVADKIVADKRLDFIIGSMHQIPNQDDFAFLDYKNINLSQLIENYYIEVLKLCKWNKFDILGHLTYPLRYIEGNGGVKVDLKPYNDLIAECFKTLIQNGKGIEINTSGLRQAYGKTFPTLEYIKMFKEMGGEILSVGSDSHNTEDLGKGILNGLELAKQAGFKYMTVFKNRKPEFLKID